MSRWCVVLEEAYRESDGVTVNVKKFTQEGESAADDFVTHLNRKQEKCGYVRRCRVGMIGMFPAPIVGWECWYGDAVRSNEAKYGVPTTRVFCEFALRCIWSIRLGGLDVDAISFLPLPLKNILDCNTCHSDGDGVTSRARVCYPT